MLKQILAILVVITLALAIGYGLYVLYGIVMDDVQLRLKEAIAEGIREGLASAINPLNWPKTLLQR